VSSRKKPARKPRKAAGGGSEKTLQYHCKAWLDKAGLWSRLLIFHVANERKGSVGAAMHFKRMGVRPGVADWLVFVPGRSVAIELKDDKGRQGADQERFQKQWEAAGNLYYVVRTLAEFQSIVNALVLF
jgi:hypothetical protein